MTPPAMLFSRFLIACLLGIGLGFLYDFLTALPRWFMHIADFIFILALFTVGIYLGFGICGGDLRPAYSLGLFIGAASWHFTIGKHIRALFSAFYRRMWNLISIFLQKFKKIFTFIPYFLKKTFALTKKSSTIE